jgi:hypothetical protein
MTSGKFLEIFESLQESLPNFRIPPHLNLNSLSPLHLHRIHQNSSPKHVNISSYFHLLCLINNFEQTKDDSSSNSKSAAKQLSK